MSPAAAVEFVKKYSLSLSAFVKALGYKYNVLGQLQRPLGKLNSKIRLVILALNLPTTEEEVHAFFELGKPKTGLLLFETKEVIDQLISSEFTKMKRSLNAIQFHVHSLERLHLQAIDIANEMVRMIPDEYFASILPKHLLEDFQWALDLVENPHKE
jgi:hypothetical protein